MSATKTKIRWGVLMLAEGSYGGGGTLVAATHGVRVHEEPEPSVEYEYDGKRAGRAPATAGMQLNVAPSSRFSKVALQQEVHGGGSAYSASVLPSAHRMLLAAGMDATLVASTSYTYAPSNEATGYGSAVMEISRRGQLYALNGVYGEGFTLTMEAGKPALFSSSFMGRLPATPTDVALPAITYPSVLPPKALAMAAAINSVSQTRVRSAVLEFTRSLTPRMMDVSTGVHGGFTPNAEREFRLTMVVEAVALSTLNPFALRDTMTSIPVTVAVGSTAFNRFVLSAAQAQIEEVNESAEGPIATWEIAMSCKASSPVLGDEVSLLFN